MFENLSNRKKKNKRAEKTDGRAAGPQMGRPAPMRCARHGRPWLGRCCWPAGPENASLKKNEAKGGIDAGLLPPPDPHWAERGPAGNGHGGRREGGRWRGRPGGGVPRPWEKEPEAGAVSHALARARGARPWWPNICALPHLLAPNGEGRGEGEREEWLTFRSGLLGVA